MQQHPSEYESLLLPYQLQPNQVRCVLVYLFFKIISKHVFFFPKLGIFQCIINFLNHRTSIAEFNIICHSYPFSVVLCRSGDVITFQQFFLCKLRPKYYINHFCSFEKDCEVGGFAIACLIARNKFAIFITTMSQTRYIPPPSKEDNPPEDYGDWSKEHPRLVFVESVSEFCNFYSNRLRNIPHLWSEAMTLLKMSSSQRQLLKTF